MKQLNPFGVVEGGFVRSMPASKKVTKEKVLIKLHLTHGDNDICTDLN